ncbi:ferredoxin reductase [Microvirga aerilata]|uniref:ferredoxin reductase n=1 Tax=Microvirga aerilata TaxID=670292 RepID=UPI00362C3310
MGKQVEWRKGTLRSVRDLTSDIRLFEIEPEGEFVVPTPGSHINVGVHIGERPDVRSYSIVGPCQDGLYRIAVKRLRDSRGGSLYMWSLQTGAQLSVSTPGNHFDLSLGRPEYILLAGGIGITPIFTMALALAHAGANFRVLYACRSRQDMALADELRLRIGDRLQVFLDEEGLVSISMRRSPDSRPAASSMCAAPSGCWRRPSAPGNGADALWTSCGSKPSATAAAMRPSRSG